MTKLTLGLGVALESVAATAMVAAQRIAMSYSNLQTESRNVGASAENIKTYTYAVSQLGGTVEEALGSIKSFGTFLKESPGNVAWVESFTGSIRNAKGQLIDTTEALDKFLNSDRFRNAQDWQKRQFIHKAGIDINTWQALTSPQSKEFIEESRRVNQNYGLDPDKLAKQGREFTQEWQAIWLRIRAIRDKFLMGLGFEEPLKRFKEWLDANHEGITRNLTAFVDAVKPFVKAFSEATTEVAEFAGAVIKWLGPNTTAWLAVAALVIKFTGFGTALSAAILLVGRLATALGALMLGPAGVALRGIAAIAGVSLGGALGAAAVGGAAALYPTPAGEGEDEKQRQENVKRDPDYYKPGHPGAAAEPKKKSLWERGKQWFNDKIGIAPAEGRETVEGQPGGETPAVARGQRLSDDQKAEMAAGIRNTAKNLGIEPEHLAAIISFETAGTMDPWKKGPTTKWGTHCGLIQWGEPQARQYGVSQNSSITQQLHAVERYLRDRGVEKGMSLEQIYGAVLAGGTSDGALDRQDKFGTTPRSGARRMWSSAHRNALAALEARLQKQANAARRPEVEPQNPVHIPERGRTKEDERWDNRPRYDYSRPGAPLVTPRARQDGGTGIARPGGVSPRTPIGHVSSSSIRHGDATVNAKTTINVSTPGDPGAAARAVAGAQNNVNADLIRNMRGAAR